MIIYTSRYKIKIERTREREGISKFIIFYKYISSNKLIFKMIHQSFLVVVDDVVGISLKR